MKEYHVINILEGIYEDCVRDNDKEYMERNLALTEAVKALTEIQQYREIGTVEECREAREKQMPKKPNITTGQNDTDKLACCPTCDSNVDWTYEGFWRKGKRKYCHECGQAIDWSETV